PSQAFFAHHAPSSCAFRLISQGPLRLPGGWPLPAAPVRPTAGCPKTHNVRHEAAASTDPGRTAASRVFREKTAGFAGIRCRRRAGAELALRPRGEKVTL